MLPLIMRPLDNVFELYRLGGAISALSRALRARRSEGIRFTDILNQLMIVQPLLSSLVADTFVPLDTCKANAVALTSTLESISQAFFSEWSPASDEDKPAVWLKPAPNAWKLIEQIEAFEYVLSAEVARASLYHVDQVGGYRTRALIETAETVFPKNIREQLPGEDVTDVRSAGKCLAFDLPTAAGFHVARAVETVLLKYFSALDITVPKVRNLGKYIEALSEAVKKGKGIDPKVIAAVDQFRNLYRNPIMHPEATLSTEEAEILFALAQSTISAIILDIAKLAVGGALVAIGGAPSIAAAAASAEIPS